MIIQFKGYTYEHLVVFDLEHDSGKLLQLACLLFNRIDNTPDLYQLKRNLNMYVRQPEVAPFISNYTNITPQFLTIHGVTEHESKLLFRSLLKDCEPATTCFVSHDISQDTTVLKANGLSIEDYCCGCTYKMARQVLGREHRLRLEDIAEECAYGAFDKHNAYTDAWSTVATLSYLTSLGGTTL